MSEIELLENSVPRETQNFFKDAVSRETWDEFEIYHQLLEKWQSKLNLVSNNSLKEFWNRHLLDSLQLIRYIPDNSRILDVGSGGGFPGAVLAITKKYSVTCLDSDFKKCCFLRNLFASLKISAEVITDRVEKLSPERHHFDIITARGFADVRSLLDIVARFDAVGVFLKGKKVEAELQVAQKDFSFQYDLHKSIVGSDGFVLVVRKCLKK